jgi:hypothetical protein
MVHIKVCLLCVDFLRLYSITHLTNYVNFTDTLCVFSIARLSFFQRLMLLSLCFSVDCPIEGHLNMIS